MIRQLIFATEVRLNVNTRSSRMSVRLLRHNISHRTICSTSHPFCLRRFYAQRTLARTPMDHGHSSENHEQNDSAAGLGAAKKTRTEKGKSSKKSKTKKLESLAPRKDPLAATRLELYLKQIRDSGPDPTLLDIERCRPDGHTENVYSPQYADEYNALVDKLCRSFSRQQLREFNIMLKFNLPARAIKHQFAEAIIEKLWKWPSLKELQKRHRDMTEISVKTFPVNFTQLFLILGKDGAELLQMSKDYNVHIAVTRRPLLLRVEGLKASLDALSEHIAAVKNAIVEETFKLPVGKAIKQDLIQPISRLADAYVENLGDLGTV
ncbi:hypothetical protein PILCRDRAFT_357891 [Piloderma croceum F 1598]|uniref:Uncharacterized protein n=1 Tax=Piloderma croceum (strain F 1598) TaxID=765440 RepID=A0A0C3G3Y3_PILCF|nr:hypothetical protein PILCRDRAFT_357891 [Piloderma croceum F 1598]